MIYVHILQHKLLYRILRLLTCVNNTACNVGMCCGIALTGKINCCSFGWVGEASGGTPSERNVSSVIWDANKATLSRINLLKKKKKPVFIARNEIWKYTKIILVAIWPLSTSAEEGVPVGYVKGKVESHNVAAPTVCCPHVQQIDWGGSQWQDLTLGLLHRCFNHCCYPWKGNGKGVMVTVIIAAD